MVKRFVSLGAAIALIFALSVSVFADSFTGIGGSYVKLDFPFYGHIRVRQGNGNSPVELYLGTDGAPTSSDSAYSLSGGEGVSTNGTVVFDFYPLSSIYNVSNAESLYWKTQVAYMTVDLQRYGEMGVHYKANGDIDYIESPILDADPHIQTEEQTLTTEKNSKISCNTVMGGSYLLEGVLEFPSNTIVDADAWNDMISGVSGTVITSQGNFAMTIPFASYDVKHINNKDRVNFKLSLGVPYSGEYQRMFFQFNSIGNSIPQLSGFSINTGSLKISDVNSISGLGYSLAGWFQEVINSIKSGFYTQNLDAGAAAQNNDEESLSTAQSDIDGIETFEQNMFQNLNGTDNPDGTHTPGLVDQLPLQVPDYSNSSMGNALMAVSYIMTSTISDLGGYQVSVTVPMCLGIMLILIGRGTLALGRAVSASARARRREGGGSK